MPRDGKHLKPHQFKKGAPSANPRGRIPNAAIQALRKVTLESYREAIEIVMTGNLKELKEIVENPTSTALQVGIATSFLTAIKKGDYHIIEAIAQRIIGKIPETLNVNSNVNATIGIFDQVALKAAIAKLESDV